MQVHALRRLVVILPLLAASLGLAGCGKLADALPGSYTDIAAISADPAKFEGREIRVKGVVASVGKFPFASTRYFTLRGPRGAELSVVTELPAPAMGREVWSYGKIENIAIIKGTGMGVHLNESRRICEPDSGSGHFSKLFGCWTR